MRKPVAAETGAHSHKIDFRIQGLPHSSVEEAEHDDFKNCNIRSKKHPHQDALQADLMQKNVYHPFSENSKKMIDDLVNVEYFELCETDSKVHCSYCLSD